MIIRRLYTVAPLPSKVLNAHTHIHHAFINDPHSLLYAILGLVVLLGRNIVPPPRTSTPADAPARGQRTDKTDDPALEIEAENHAQGREVGGHAQGREVEGRALGIVGTGAPTLGDGGDPERGDLIHKITNDNEANPTMMMR